jgi:hypothetical protein
MSHRTKRTLELFPKLCTREFKYDHLELKDSGYIKDQYGTIPITFQKGGRGDRLLFICPNCRKRFLILYLVNNQYACRNCHKLNYKSSQCAKGFAYLQHKLDKFEAKTGLGLFCADEKPKFMKWKTYEKNLNKIIALRENAFKIKNKSR